MITWNDFEQVQMHTGTIIEVHDFPEARNPAYQLLIDFGTVIGLKKSSAQITKLYSKDELLNRQVIGVTNFPPKQIGPFLSECLVLGVIPADGEVVLLRTDRTVPNGLRIL